ncbi:MAG: hypothetical protein GYA15_02260 [Leptolinea sp.]|jgi:transcription elongation factor Elf1|nr:hypothetical protein [Leptolinea sp.]
MSGLRCPECESFVGTSATAEVESTDFDESTGEMEVEIRMVLCCENCDHEFGEFVDTSIVEVDGYLDYLDENDEAEENEKSYDEAEVEPSIQTRKGKKYYVAKWTSKVYVGEKVFSVQGEMSVTRDQFDLYN